MKLITTIVRSLSAAAVFVGLALSFVGSFVSLSVHSEGLNMSVGESGWHKIGPLGLLLALMALVAAGTALGLGLAGKAGVARILDVCAAGALVVSIVVLVVFVLSNKPDGADELGFSYGLGWSGYAVLGLFGLATLLSVVAAALPNVAVEPAPTEPSPHQLPTDPRL
ncbi:MAG: hypothetical protein QOJ72_1109 [Nocardioidaceae bacterium]|jgi:hypothetical protein|nr:hypothetical protein [Nocardioidaceae bacterium]